MTKLVTNGLILIPYEPIRPGKSKIKKGMELKGYKILEVYKDQNKRLVYLVECMVCAKKSYNRFTHPNKIVGCRSCTAKKENRLHIHKIGKRIGTYTIIDYVRKENGIPYAKIKCDCGYEGTRRNLKRLGKCQKCKFPSSPNNKIGTSFGKLNYIKYLGKQKYQAICDCGKKCIVHSESKSCGCLKRLHNPRAKHSHLEVKALRELFETGSYTKKDLCEMFNLDDSHFSKIIKHKRYRF